MHAMAQEIPEASLATSSTESGNRWEIDVNPFSSWSTMIRRLRPPPPPNRHANLSWYEEADMSISNASHSALSMDSSSADLSGEPVENHIWSQVLLSVETAGEVQNSHDDGGENCSYEVLSSKRLTTDHVLEPAACDYLKKMEYSGDWQLSPYSSLNCLEKHLSSYNGSIMEPERPTSNLSDLVTNWSIAPPNSQHIAPSTTCNIVSITPSVAHYLASNISHVKHEIPISPLYPSNPVVGESSTSYFPSYDHSMIRGDQSQSQDTAAAATPFFLRSQNPNSTRYQIGLDDSAIGLNSDNFCSGMAEVNPWSSRINLSDQASFGRCLNKRVPMGGRGLKPSVKGSALCDRNKQGFESSTITRNGRVGGTTEGKKKRSEDSSETLLNKTKYDSSMVSSHKMQQVPKVKIAEKISALQQLVSPFGKTDQASVLMETITCIRILQEQVRLLSDPYLKSSASKEHNSWGDMERKEKAEPKHDLRSKGLCLVPVSSIPQVHRENNRPDYWMPTYRSCLYR